MTQYREKTNSVPPSDLREILKRVGTCLEGVTNDGREDMPIKSLRASDILKLYDMVAGARQNTEKASVGLLTYPVLMAADILLYRTTHVPVGSDQVQHLNLARDIAQKFNHEYGSFFIIPEAILSDTARVMSLQDGTKKMSKSDPNDNTRINLTDSPEIIEKKIKKATADTRPFPSCEEEIVKPEVRNLISIYCALAGGFLIYRIAYPF